MISPVELQEYHEQVLEQLRRTDELQELQELQLQEQLWILQPGDSEYFNRGTVRQINRSDTPLQTALQVIQSAYNGVRAGAAAAFGVSRGRSATGTSTRPSSLHLAFERALQDNNYEELLRLQELLSRRSTTGDPRAKKPRGASKAMLEKKTTKRKATASDKEDTDGQKEQCVICMEDIKQGTTLKVLNCGHKFHSRCIDRWLKRKATCPVCNAPL